MTMTDSTYWLFTAAFCLLLIAFGSLLVEYLHVRAGLKKWQERSDEWQSLSDRWELRFNHLNDTHDRVTKELRDKRAAVERANALLAQMAADIEAHCTNPSLEEGGF